MEYQTLSIRKLLDGITSGAIRIPAFQREFVWEPELIAYLMDSIYKGYPFGSLLFWRTKNQLSIERKLGPFSLPEPQDDYPIDYVLDGQQRLTSIFYVFQNEFAPDEDADEWPEIYFDFDAEANAQDSQFVAFYKDDYESLPREENRRYFPLRVLFDSVAYREATEGLDKETTAIIDKLQEAFKEVTVPIQLVKTEDRSIVAIVFERVNRLGQELDTLQLLSAWTWNENFDLLEQFDELKEELQEYGFSQVGEDSELVLRCAAAVLTGDPRAESLLDLNGEYVRGQFPRVRNGILGAVDFLRTQLNVVALKNLPYSSLLVPLSTLFAEPDGKDVVFHADTHSRVSRWFWRSCFSGRYRSQTIRTTVRDIEEMNRLKKGEPSELDSVDVKLSPHFFIASVFRLGNAGTKTFILMLAQNRPKTFLSGADVDIGNVLQKYNRAEFHHIYPKKFLREQGVGCDEINCLANFAFLSGAENRKVSSKAPSSYLELMPNGQTLDAIMLHSFLPQVTFENDFSAFVEQRSRILADEANRLMGA